MDWIYGPISSLRYGTTLGVNLLGPQKVCSFNCGYCDLGPSLLTMNQVRKEHLFPSPEQLTQALRLAVRALQTEIKALVISGNGEPTLHPEFDEVMRHLVAVRREILLGIPIVVLTNGAHLDSKRVVSGLNMADARIIKMDAGGDSLFKNVNNPLVRTTVAKILNNAKKLTDTTAQSLFVRGAVDNTTAEAVEEWVEVLGILKPKAVQIMTLRRPPVDGRLSAVDDDTLYTIAHKLKKRTQLEATVYSSQ